MSQLDFFGGILAGMQRAQQARREGKQLMVFDWNAAAAYLRDNGIKDASAGLSGDLGYTSGVILRDGKPVTDDYTYLASMWAVPVLVLGDDTEVPMVTSEASGFDESTKWPASALAI